MTLLLLLGCGPPDACDAMCDAALVRYTACLEASGLEWGPSTGYTDPADYTNWCETWSWEARQLDEAGTCAEKQEVFLDGTCDDYWAAWSDT